MIFLIIYINFSVNSLWTKTVIETDVSKNRTRKSTRTFLRKIHAVSPATTDNRCKVYHSSPFSSLCGDKAWGCWALFLTFSTKLVCYSFVTMGKTNSFCFSTIVLPWHSLKTRMECICWSISDLAISQLMSILLQISFRFFQYLVFPPVFLYQML